ncbi:RNA polymerase sigma factor (sigma-70 family) [Hungatella effluvii]|uniref:RNA polymerase sigma factor (Sigma-70 family) n=1 Tax=Hungatella effluvii TaxID=1096246 RepID=A0A2V3XUK4_9FIRM|nr:sigma-70 family RNA polymerase sigma factor [Hungatella effluvii]PXX44572.1 RNA polymerase sigma factor (sigma-70 family) [Hungatella effluvii]
MNNERFEWQTRCEFNAYCKHTLRNELINACKESKRRQQREVIFSDLAPHEERQLFTVDKYFANEEKDDAFRVGDLKITAKLLAEALRTLPDEKRKAVLLYYFVNKSDVEIAEELGIPRSTVQYRRTSSFEQLKRYLEERADEWDEW